MDSKLIITMQNKGIIYVGGTALFIALVFLAYPLAQAHESDANVRNIEAVEDNAPSLDFSEVSSWFNIGLGVGKHAEQRTSGIDIISGLFGFHGQLKYHLVSIRLSTFSKLNPLALTTEEHLWDVGIMYGQSRSGSFIYSSLSVGLAYMQGRIGQYDETTGFGKIASPPDDYERFSAPLSLPLEAHLTFRITSSFAMGFGFHFNLNQHANFGGITLNLQTGSFH